MRRFSIPVLTLSKKAKGGLAAAALVALSVWLAFFDSHSIARRLQWSNEVVAVSNENTALLEQIRELEGKLEEADSDAVIEQIAREQYGMRRPGEQVYRVQAAYSPEAED